MSIFATDIRVVIRVVIERITRDSLLLHRCRLSLNGEYVCLQIVQHCYYYEPM